MLILSNCLTERTDEGCLKVANSLVKRLLQEKPDVPVITYDRKPQFESLHIRLNKFLFNKKLFRTIREKNQPVLYIPFPARETATALRVFILSRASRKKVTVLLTMRCQCGMLGRLLFKLSGADLVTLSRDTEQLYKKIVGEHRVTYLKTGVDTEKFTPVSSEQKMALREKYGLDPAKPVVLHVGHLKSGRNVGQLMKLDPAYQALLVVSTHTKDEQDTELKEALLQHPNVKIIDTYLPDIEEVYQLADVYFFPVVAPKNCIDVPLSCLEAAACGKPVVTTDYGEMAAFRGVEGFRFIESFDGAYLNQIVADALAMQKVPTREAVLAYDWRKGVSWLKAIG